MDDGREELAREGPKKKDVLESWTTVLPDGRTELRLEEPVPIGTIGGHVEVLRFVRMKAKHLRAMRDASTDSFLALAEAMCGETRRTIDDLSVADAMRVIELVGRGFPDGPPAGGPG
jgi:hypothetical protein